MFEAMNNVTLNVSGGGNITPPKAVVPLPAGEKTAGKTASDDVLPMEKIKLAEQKQAHGNRQVTEAMLEELEHDINTMHSIGLKFSKHNDTGRTFVKVLNKENNEVIREIPSEDVLDLAGKIGEMIGILFDKEV